jgi:hypothetical protein
LLGRSRWRSEISKKAWKWSSTNRVSYQRVLRFSPGNPTWLNRLSRRFSGLGRLGRRFSRLGRRFSRLGRLGRRLSRLGRRFSSLGRRFSSLGRRFSSLGRRFSRLCRHFSWQRRHCRRLYGVSWHCRRLDGVSWHFLHASNDFMEGFLCLLYRSLYHLIGEILFYWGTGRQSHRTLLSVHIPVVDIDLACVLFNICL